jgi:hypothetical protein
MRLQALRARMKAIFAVRDRTSNIQDRQFAAETRSGSTLPTPCGGGLSLPRKPSLGGALAVELDSAFPSLIPLLREGQDSAMR